MGGPVLVLEDRLVAFGRDRRGWAPFTEEERTSYAARIREAEVVADLSSSHRLVLIQMAKLAARGICFASQEEIRRRAGIKSVRTVGRAWVVLRRQGLIVPQVMPMLRTRGWVVLPSARTGQIVRSSRPTCRTDARQNVRQNENRNKEESAARRPQRPIQETSSGDQPVLADQLKELVASLAAAKRPAGCLPARRNKTAFN